MSQATTKAAWEECDCGSFMCRIHGEHASDCACPSLQFWDEMLGMNPYEQGGDLTPEELQERLKAAGYSPDMEE